LILRKSGVERERNGSGSTPNETCMGSVRLTMASTLAG
jgi:hypothetical protein